LLEDTVAVMAAETARQVDLVATEFELAPGLPDVPNTYIRGLVRGFARRERPILAFLQSTYWKGYTPDVLDVIARFRNEGIAARVVPGIWQTRIPVEHLAEQYYHCAKAAGGYWIYPMSALHPQSTDPLHAPRGAYWEAIRRANQELDHLARDPSHTSSLTVRPFRPIRPQVADATLPDLVPAVTSTPAAPASPVMFRRSNALVFFASKGDTLHFEFQLRISSRREEELAETVLLSRNGNTLAQADARMGQPAVLEATAQYTGPYQIALRSGGHTLNLTSWSHPFSVQVRPAARLRFVRQLLYLWQPPGSRVAEIALGAGGPGESYTAILRSDTGVALGSCDVINEATLRVALPPAPGGALRVLQLQARPGAKIEDVKLEVKSGLGRYISPSPSGLVRPARIP
jgi:hypothetical protein